MLSWWDERHGGMTHLLLATLITGALHTGLALFLGLGMVIVMTDVAGRTAIGAGQAATLPLMCAIRSVAGVYRAGWADWSDPASNHGRTVHGRANAWGGGYTFCSGGRKAPRFL